MPLPFNFTFPPGFAGLLLLSGAAFGQTPPAPAAAMRFDVFEYRVEGNSVLEVERIERAVYPFLGEQRTAADVESARTALETAYRDAGFGTVTVDTPEQRIVDGVVTFQVVQAAVARLRVVGAKYFSQDRILAAVPALAEGTVPNFKLATEQLATVNRSAERRVTPLLRPGKAVGTTEVDLTVEDKLPLHASVEINNRYSANTTPSRLLASLRYDNLWQREHSIGLQFQTSPQNVSEVRVFSGSYSIPVDSGVLAFSAVRSNSSSVAGVGDTSVFGRGNIFGVRRIVVLEGSENRSQVLTLGADYKDFKESVAVGDNQGFDTPVHYLPLSVSYASTLGSGPSSWQWGGGLVVALRDLASEPAQFADKRYLAQNNFAVLKLDLARTQPLPWAGLSFFGKLEGQISSQPLISNEQFVAGGVDSVRGYLEAAAVGDLALRGSAEVRSANLAPKGWPWLESLRLHAFIDAATLALKSPLPGQQARFELFGLGVGLKAQIGPYGSLSADLGQSLRDAGSNAKSGLKLHASASLGF